MEFLILLFIGWIMWSVVVSAAKKQQTQLPPPEQPTVPDWYSLAESEHVRMVGGAQPAAVLPVRAPMEESSSELPWDELAHDTELAAFGAPPVDVVSLESTDVMPPPERLAPTIVSLEQEVDRETEHENFHRRYVDARAAGASARYGLLDEMRDPAALRRAVLMAEILGPPRSLRR